MINREITKKINDLIQKYPIISIVGPRQSGKTTLVKDMFSDYRYINFEDLETRALVEEDPKGFLKKYDKYVIFDEIQKIPSLFSYLLVAVDEEESLNARFILTGSQNFSLSEAISQSLAGRVANFVLLPLSVKELGDSKFIKDNHVDQILAGFYPRLYTAKLSQSDLYRDYINTYVERDVRQLKNIGDLSLFQKFMRLLAGRTGQILNLNSIGNDLGLDSKTVESWISTLEASYIVFRLQPYYKSFNKRIIKNPKLYFYDVGLATYLLGVDSSVELQSHYALGALFENLVIADLIKQIENSRSSDQLYFWRDNTGNEIDCIVDRGLAQLPVEIKLSATFNSRFLKYLTLWKDINKEGSSEYGFILYTGDQDIEVRDNKLLNWRKVNTLLQ